MLPGPNSPVHAAFCRHHGIRRRDAERTLRRSNKDFGACPGSDFEATEPKRRRDDNTRIIYIPIVLQHNHQHLLVYQSCAQSLNRNDRAALPAVDPRISKRPKPSPAREILRSSPFQKRRIRNPRGQNDHITSPCSPHPVPRHILRRIACFSCNNQLGGRHPRLHHHPHHIHPPSPHNFRSSDTCALRLLRQTIRGELPPRPEFSGENLPEPALSVLAILGSPQVRLASGLRRQPKE